MTDVELLKNSIDVLGAINVPVVLLEGIGAPIYQVRKNLMNLMDAINSNAQKAAEEQEVVEPTEE